jgi:hypothetical protein
MEVDDSLGSDSTDAHELRIVGEFLYSLAVLNDIWIHPIQEYRNVIQIVIHDMSSLLRKGRMQVIFS